MGNYAYKQIDFEHPSFFFILEDKLKNLLGGPLLYNPYFKTFGLAGNERVLDFGCGSGHYCIPAARVVGENGKVFALDKEDRVFSDLADAINDCGLTNIETSLSPEGSKFSLTDETFEVPDDFDIDDFMESSFGAFHGKPEKARVLFSADIAEYIKEKIWHNSQKLIDTPDGSVLFEADVACTKEFKAWVMRWGAKAIVLEPEKLRDEIQSETVEMLAAYARDIEQVEKTLPA